MKPALKPSQVLQRVKKMLPSTYTSQDDNSPYICDNIRDLWRQGYLEDTTKDMLTAHIRVKLDNAFSLKEWLIGNGHITNEQWKTDLNKNDGATLQYTRQLWLDDMIKDFKLKGF